MKRTLLILMATAGMAMAGAPFVVITPAPQPIAPANASANGAVSQIIAQQARQQSQLNAAAAQNAAFQPVYLPQRVTVRAGK